MTRSILLAAALGSVACTPSAEDARPNILFAISDDQSWVHASAFGDPAIETPAESSPAASGRSTPATMTSTPAPPSTTW